jgi:tetratricopeptide (TPR) repeat protein
MRTGTPAPRALAGLLRADPDSQVRQVAMIDAQGRVAAHTGSRDIPPAGQHVGRSYSVQANLMRNDRVWPAMARAFETTKGDLADRLLAALDAAEAAGGDIRGRQSAALIVVSGDRNAPPWQKKFDLRVEDHPAPLVELRRLVRMARAYQAATDGDNYVAAGKIDSALVSYRRASEILPDSATNGELIYWVAVTLADQGRVDESLPLFRRAFAEDKGWAELLPRLPGVGLLRADEATITRIVREAR